MALARSLQEYRIARVHGSLGYLEKILTSKSVGTMFGRVYVQD
ncbi:hypothetical protein DSUL_50358 [Desulfovibrionales bacterium]